MVHSADDLPSNTTQYLRLPVGIVLLRLFAGQAARALRVQATRCTRIACCESQYGASWWLPLGDPLCLPTYVRRLSWTDCVCVYLFTVLSFLTLLFVVENVRDLFSSVPRQLSLRDDYETASVPRVDVPTAFYYDTPMTYYEHAKVAFFIVSGIFALRLVVFVLTMIVCVVLLGIASRRERKTHETWFNFWATIGCALSNLALAAVGIYNVRIFGHFAPRSACKLLISNHSCIIEVLLLFTLADFPSFVSRVENMKIFMFGNVLRAGNALLVDRAASFSRRRTLDAILERVRNPDERPLMIFPEGTTNNQRTLFMFKKGAFEAGKAVQMVCFYFPYKHFNPAWTGRSVGGNDPKDIMIRLCCQFVNRVELRILPVYYPTEEEQSDAVLYAKHCQHIMAAILNENVSDATYSDYKDIEAHMRRKTAVSGTLR